MQGFTTMNNKPSHQSNQQSSRTSDQRPRLSNNLIVKDAAIKNTVIRRLDDYESKSNARGIFLTFHTDFDHYCDINRHIDKLPPWPSFNPEFSDLGADNAFWIKGVDERGEIVHTHACRLDDLTGTCLANHLISLRAFYRDPKKSAHPMEHCESKAPATYGITGKVCYQGELWIKREGFRGKDLAMILPRISMFLALALWSPDYIYGLVDDFVVKKGLVAKYGHYNIQQHGSIMHRPQDSAVYDEWIEWATWREMVDQVERC
jgi:hypothetical protein